MLDGDVEPTTALRAVDSAMSDVLSVALVGRFKHGDLTRAMRERGWNQNRLGKELGWGPSCVGMIVNMRHVPRRLTDAQVSKLLELTGKLPDQLWPEWSRDRRFLEFDKRVVAIRDLSESDMRRLQSAGTLSALRAPDEIVSASELHEIVGGVLQTLMPREEQIIRMRFGLDGRGETSLDDVAESFGVSRERIRQIEAKALRKLRHPSRSKRYRSFLDPKTSDEKARREANERLSDIYAGLPSIECKGLCHQACGPICCAPLEADRMQSYSGLPLTFDKQTASCGYLTADKRCSVHPVRPIVCRLYGVTNGLPCAFGCKPECVVPDRRAQEIIDDVTYIGGGVAAARETRT